MPGAPGPAPVGAVKRARPVAAVAAHGGGLEILASQKPAVDGPEHQRREGADKDISDQREDVHGDQHAEEVDRGDQPVGEFLAGDRGQGRVVPRLDSHRHVVEEQRGEDGGDGDHQEDRQPDHQQERSRAEEFMDAGGLADPGQVEGVWREADEQVEERRIDGDKQRQRQRDTDEEDAQEPAVGDLAEGEEEGAEDHGPPSVGIREGDEGVGRMVGTNWLRLTGIGSSSCFRSRPCRWQRTGHHFRPASTSSSCTRCVNVAAPSAGMIKFTTGTSNGAAMRCLQPRPCRTLSCRACARRPCSGAARRRRGSTAAPATNHSKSSTQPGKT